MPTPLAIPVTVTWTVPPTRGRRRHRRRRRLRHRVGGAQRLGRRGEGGVVGGQPAVRDLLDGRGHEVQREPRADDPGREVEDVAGPAVQRRRDRGADPPWSSSPATPVAAFAEPEVEMMAFA